jgi:hypothetical protein
MKNILSYILLCGFSQLNAQTKKERINMLNITIDSLSNILSSERNTNSINQKENIKLVAKYKSEIELKNNSLKIINKELEISRKTTDSLINELSSEITIINELSSEIAILKDSLKKIATEISKKTKLLGQRSKIVNPNDNLELNTVILNSNNENYIITDSIFSTINENEFSIYFLTPIKYLDQLECPYEYGVIVLNKEKNEVYSSFWDMSSVLTKELFGNCLPKLYQYKTDKGTRNLLSLGNSGCGSGRSFIYFDVCYKNKNIQFTPKLRFGFHSDVLFVPEKNIYLLIERVKSECNHGCPSKYRISSYLLSTDILIKTSLTKWAYEDYNDIGINNLLKKVQQKENLFFY